MYVCVYVCVSTHTHTHTHAHTHTHTHTRTGESAEDVAGKEGERAQEGGAKDAAGAGKGDASDALVAAAAGSDGASTQWSEAIQKALKEAEELFNEGILSMEQYQEEQAAIMARNQQAPQSMPPTKKRRSQKAEQQLVFDQYHQSLYTTVLNLLAPGQSAAAEQAAAAAWELIKDVIDPNHIIAQRWRMRIAVHTTPIKHRIKKVCEHGRRRQACLDCDRMKLEMVSIIYSITAQYEAAAHAQAVAISAAEAASASSRPSGKKSRDGAPRKRNNSDGAYVDGKGKGNADSAAPGKNISKVLFQVISRREIR